MISSLPLLDSLPPARFEEPVVLKAVARAARQLAELKGVVAAIPHQAMLINTLAQQEAKDSSAIENIVTTQDQLFRDEASSEAQRRPAAKEVLRYRQAIRVGHDLVSASGMITNRHLRMACRYRSTSFAAGRRCASREASSRKS